MASRGPGAPVPPTLIFVVGFLAGLWWDGQSPWPIQTAGSSTVRLAVGTGVCAFGLWLFGEGLMTFARLRTGIMLQRAATRVVTSGPYQWSRNPMYVSFVAIYLGGALIANTVWPMILLPVVITALAFFVIDREERYMRRTFRSEYDAYCRRVQRWL